MESSGHELLLPLVEEENACLPLPINAVSRYWNVEIPLQEADERSKRYPDGTGSILIEGIELAESRGLACTMLHSSVSVLKKIVDAGMPPIVILPGIPEITQHASVISGYDPDAGTVFHYVQKGTQEGQQQEGAIPQDVFDREWSEDGRIIILLGPPDAVASAGTNRQNADANRLCLESERLNMLKEYTAALDSLKKALELDPTNITALQMFGAMLNEHNSDRCVEFYERCISINDRCYLAYSGLGNYYLKNGKFDKAESLYTKAIRTNPKRSAKIYKNRAYLREKQGKNADARDDLKEYLRLLPGAADRGAIELAIRELGAQ